MLRRSRCPEAHPRGVRARYSRRTIVCAGLTIVWLGVLAPSPTRAGGEPGTPKYAATVTFRRASLRALETLWIQQPVAATWLGVHRYDGQLASHLPAARAAASAQLLALQREIRAISPRNLDPNDQIDRELMLANLEDRRLDLADAKAWSTDPVLYAEECVNGIYFLQLRQGSPATKRATAALRRMRQIPRVLAEMRVNVSHPSAILATAAAEQLETGANFLEGLAGDSPSFLGAIKRSDLEQSAPPAIAAMRAAATTLRAQAAAGTAYTGLGRATYEAKLAAVHFLPYDSDSLIRLGERVLRQTQTEIAALLVARDTESQWLPSPDAGKEAPAPESFNRSSVLASYRSEIAEVRQLVANKGLLTIPDEIGELVPLEVPSFMRALMPGMGMEPAAPFETPFPGDRAVDPAQRRIVTQGTFYVRPLPDPFTPAARQRYYAGMLNHSFRSAIAHEGFPGHHVQSSSANLLIDPVRRAQQCSSFAEGWALYCEELMQRNRVTDDPWARVGMLHALRFRACQAIIDAKLQRHEMTVPQAIAFLRENADADSMSASREVGRNCHEPLQAMSYLAGKEMIVALREEYRILHPADYSLRRFHDDLLAVGTIPLPLARRLLLGAVPPLKTGR